MYGTARLANCTSQPYRSHRVEFFLIYLLLLLLLPFAALLQAKGVDTIACISVNDAFVMDAWGKTVGAGDKVLMLADGNGQFAKALGVELDLVDKGLGVRSRRFAMLVDDQVRESGVRVGRLGLRVEGAAY